MTNLSHGKTIIDVDIGEKMESHDCGSGDYACTVHHSDGTSNDQCEVFCSGGPQWWTLKDCSGPTFVDLDYDPKKKAA